MPPPSSIPVPITSSRSNRRTATATKPKKKSPKAPLFTHTEEPEFAYYHSSESLQDRPGAKYFADLARGHWAGCEIRNHWVRDSQMFEDRTRIRDYNINANLATLRCCLLAIKASRLSHLSWQQVIETAQSNPAFAYQLISNYRLK